VTAVGSHLRFKNLSLLKTGAEFFNCFSRLCAEKVAPRNGGAQLSWRLGATHIGANSRLDFFKNWPLSLIENRICNRDGSKSHQIRVNRSKYKATQAAFSFFACPDFHLTFSPFLI
jgi:hypothetical protein